MKLNQDEALFAARLHIDKGTLLSDDAVRAVCLLVLELHRERDEAVNHREQMLAKLAELSGRLTDTEAERTTLAVALHETLENDCYHPENLPDGDERCRRAHAALDAVRMPAPGGGGVEISATDAAVDRGPPSARCGQQNEGKNGGTSDGG